MRFGDIAIAELIEHPAHTLNVVIDEFNAQCLFELRACFIFWMFCQRDLLVERTMIAQVNKPCAFCYIGVKIGDVILQTPRVDIGDHRIIGFDQFAAKINALHIA